MRQQHARHSVYRVQLPAWPPPWRACVRAVIPRGVQACYRECLMILAHQHSQRPVVCIFPWVQWEHWVHSSQRLYLWGLPACHLVPKADLLDWVQWEHTLILSRGLHPTTMPGRS